MTRRIKLGSGFKLDKSGKVVKADRKPRDAAEAMRMRSSKKQLVVKGKRLG